MMVLLVAGYVAAANLPFFGPAVNGLTAAVVGILLATTYRLGRSNIKEPLTLGLGIASFVTGVFLGINAALIVVGAGVIGIPLLSATTTCAGYAREAIERHGFSSVRFKPWTG